MIPGTVPIIAASPVPILTYRTQVNSNSNALSYTYNSINIGSESARRGVIVAVNNNLDTVTINGVSASLVRGVASVEIWAAYVPTGTSVSIVAARASVTMDNNAIGVWTIDNLRSLTASVDDSGVNGFSIAGANIDVEANGVIIAAGRANGGSISWEAGVSEDAELTGDTGFPFSIASAQIASAGSVFLDADRTGVALRCCAASFR